MQNIQIKVQADILLVVNKTNHKCLIIIKSTHISKNYIRLVYHLPIAKVEQANMNSPPISGVRLCVI